MSPLILDRNFSGALSESIEDYPEGIVIPMDKPYRWTSADLVRKIKWASCHHFHKKNLKVGHAGTLDPLATGVLLVCLGKATKMAEEFQASPKEYVAGVRFGATTPSYDREKDIDRFYPVEGIDEESLRKSLEGFIGEQEQVAPLFSAKSVDGVRAYEMARAQYRKALKEGSSFDHEMAQVLSRQKITIYEMELQSFQLSGHTSPVKEETDSRSSRINVIDTSSLTLPLAQVRVRCSKGTYIRALARDMGEALGSGAFLESLRRTQNAGFRVEDAIGVDEALTLLGRNEKDN